MSPHKNSRVPSGAHVSGVAAPSLNTTDLSLKYLTFTLPVETWKWESPQYFRIFFLFHLLPRLPFNLKTNARFSPQGFPILLPGLLCHGPHELRAIGSVTDTSTLEQRVSIAHLHHQLSPCVSLLPNDYSINIHTFWTCNPHATVLSVDGNGCVWVIWIIAASLVSLLENKIKCLFFLNVSTTKKATVWLHREKKGQQPHRFSWKSYSAMQMSSEGADKVSW